jgi:hypothetical protein
MWKENLGYFILAVLVAVSLYFLIRKLTESMEVVSVNGISQESHVGVGSSVSFQEQVSDIEPLNMDFSGADISGMSEPVEGRGDIVPIELLPNNDAAAIFAQENPSGTGNVQNVALLAAGFNIGMDTRGGTLKNPSLDIRPEPHIPKEYVGPFYQSSYEPDLYRGNICA